MRAQIAFYKGKGTWVDKAIRFWTRSKYSHVELVIGGVWYSTSPRDLKVRAKKINPSKDHWDYVGVDIDKEHVLELFQQTEGAKYDWVGIFLYEFLPLKIHNPSKWYCSEWVATALKIKPAQVSPAGLAIKLNIPRR